MTGQTHQIRKAQSRQGGGLGRAATGKRAARSAAPPPGGRRGSAARIGGRAATGASSQREDAQLSTLSPSWGEGFCFGKGVYPVPAVTSSLTKSCLAVMVLKFRWGRTGFDLKFAPEAACRGSCVGLVNHSQQTKQLILNWLSRPNRPRRSPVDTCYAG